jgi:hypothetical protein
MAKVQKILDISKFHKKRALSHRFSTTLALLAPNVEAAL